MSKRLHLDWFFWISPSISSQITQFRHQKVACIRGLGIGAMGEVVIPAFAGPIFQTLPISLARKQNTVHCSAFGIDSRN